MDFDFIESLENLFPENAQLHLTQAIAHAAVNTKTKRHMRTSVAALDVDLIGVFKDVLISVSRDVPHEYLVPGFN